MAHVDNTLPGDLPIVVLNPNKCDSCQMSSTDMVIMNMTIWKVGEQYNHRWCAMCFNSFITNPINTNNITALQANWQK